MTPLDSRLYAVVQAQPYPLLFASLSGAHLYGFASPNSDFDLRGVHLLPVEKVVGLESAEETLEISEKRDDLDLDLVTHDAKKYFNMLLKKNGYVLEQLYSPLSLHTTPAQEELKAIARTCITRHHAHHYFGFAATEWKLLNKQETWHIKPLLYVYRVLLTGIHLMETGEVEANLSRLNHTYPQAHIPDLIARKTSGAEHDTLPDVDKEFHEKAYRRLIAQLERAFEASKLPETPAGREALNDLLVRLRIKGLEKSAD